MLDRTRRDLSQEEIELVADTYHAWRSGADPAEEIRHDNGDRDPEEKGTTGDDYEDVPGFCKSATLEEIRQHSHILTPWPVRRRAAAGGRRRAL